MPSRKVRNPFGDNAEILKLCRKIEMSDRQLGPDESAAKSQNPFSPYSLLGSAQQLEDQAIQQTPLLGRLCLSGEATVWYARYNTGKTLICLHLIIEAVQQGRIVPDDVLYINADDSQHGLSQKVRLMQDHGVHVVAPGMKDFESSMFLEKVEAMVSTGTAQGKLIVIDTLKKFVDVMDKKRARAFTAVIRTYVMQGGTLLALAHTNKRVGSDGKPIPEGTGDILSDFDCGYVLSPAGEVNETGDRIVEFECVKSRGPSAFRVQYSYDAASDIDYIERLCSIREVDLNDPDYDPDESPNCDDSDIVEAIELSIHHGSVQKMDIVRLASMASRASRRKVLAVLDKHTGDDVELHKWNFTVQARGAKVYALLKPRV